MNINATTRAFFRRRSLVPYGTRRPCASRRDIVRLFRVGAPIGGQWVLGMLSFAAFTTLVSHMGDTAMAASQAFVALLSLSFMQAVGISTAVSTLVGRYVGAREPGFVARSFRSGVKTMMSTMSCSLDKSSCSRNGSPWPRPPGRTPCEYDAKKSQKTKTVPVLKLACRPYPAMDCNWTGKVDF